MRLENKVAIVTGGGRGIGKAIARGFAAEGASVVVTGRTMSEIEAVAVEMRASGRGALAVSADVRTPQDARSVVEKTLAEFGRVDVLVNNAGTTVIKPTLDLTEDDWDLVMDTNVKGSFLMAQAVARVMLPARTGAIINIGSIASFVGMPGRAVYCATKGAIAQLTRALAVEWAPHGIRVNCLAPGYVRTEGHERLVAQGFISREALAAATPAGRVADVDEMVGPAVFLASEDARFVHGETLLADGGWVADAHVPGMPHS